jgi:hypothetical protein
MGQMKWKETILPTRFMIHGTKEEHRLEWIVYLQIAVLLLSPEL